MKVTSAFKGKDLPTHLTVAGVWGVGRIFSPFLKAQDQPKEDIKY